MYLVCPKSGLCRRRSKTPCHHFPTMISPEGIVRKMKRHFPRSRNSSPNKPYSSLEADKKARGNSFPTFSTHFPPSWHGLPLAFLSVAIIGSFAASLRSSGTYGQRQRSINYDKEDIIAFSSPFFHPSFSADFFRTRQFRHVKGWERLSQKRFPRILRRGRRGTGTGSKNHTHTHIVEEEEEA